MDRYKDKRYYKYKTSKSHFLYMNKYMDNGYIISAILYLYIDIVNYVKDNSENWFFMFLKVSHFYDAFWL